MAEIYIKVDQDTHVVTFVHRRPFDPINGLGISREELLKTGFFVDEFPEPVPRIGKRATAYYDHEKKQVYYEYGPTPFTAKNRLDLMEQATNDMIVMLGSFINLAMDADTGAPSTINANNGIALMSANKLTPIVKVPSSNSDEEDDSKDNESQIGGGAKAMMNGFAKYLASQIYQGKLYKDMVMATYPTLKDQIESALKEWESIPE